jgi:hypothetical protein
VSLNFQRIKRWLGGEASKVEETVEGAEPVTTPPLGDDERETSTNAQMEGAADEPWPGKS